MQRLARPHEARSLCQAWRQAGHRLALVPTMGFLHQGHLSLIRWAREHADKVAVSLFVNPTQFAPGEDLASYPRALERDAAMAAEAGADLLFHPETTAMYAPDHATWVEVPAMGSLLCGASRPIHFRGVCTVVCKLFNLLQPHVAAFGEKDWQQVAIIRRMARDLDMPVEIVGRPTIREDDGLAMSSRNSYLTPEERAQAPQLHAGMRQVQTWLHAGQRDAKALAQGLASWYAEHFTLATPDYIAIVDPETLVAMDRVDVPARLAVACRLGRARLIDNMPLLP